MTTLASDDSLDETDVLLNNEAAIKNGDPLSALSPDDQERLSEILETYLDGLERGRPCDPDELVAKHSHLAEPFRWYLRSLDFVHHAAADLGASGDGTKTQSITPHELGEFQIVREIGRGGMGIVYEARQKSLGRRVALKILPFAAVLDQRQIMRFKNEAQAAAQLHHPHIVPVHSVGCDRGVHYYSMQFIDGQALDQAITQLEQLRERSDNVGRAAFKTTKPNRSFSTERSFRSDGHVGAAAELIRQAADAIQHAHEFGVVHRDIKPSNLLIDQLGKLWVTDFGLARCQDTTALTITGDLLGTVRYMSPEAAAGRGNLVDHLSDVYSLGVTLYELLTLQQPHQATERSKLLDQIQNQQPEPPRRLNPSIPIDLETIVLKAIEKARDDRYESASALGEDLARFLDGKPPLAKRPSLFDRGARWASRHRKLVASVACALLATSIGTAIAATMLSSEKQKTEVALDTARSNLNQSQMNLQKAIDVVDRFGVRLASKLAGIPGAESVRREVLEETLQDYESFAAQLQNDTSMQFALALCQTQMATMHRQLGQYQQAVANYQSAIEIYQQLSEVSGVGDQVSYGTNPDPKRVRHDLAVCHNNLGELAFQGGDFDKAENQYGNALSIARDLCGVEQENLKYRRLLSAIAVNLGNLQRTSGRVAEARETLLEAVAMQRLLCKSDPDSDSLRRELAVTYAQLAFLFSQSDLELADGYNRQAIEIHQAVVDASPNDLRALSELATCYNHRGAIYNRAGKQLESLSAYRQAISVQDQLLVRAPTVVRYREQLAVGHNNVGQILVTSRESLDDAAGHFERSRDLLLELVESSPESPRYAAQLGGVQANLASLISDDSPDEAQRYFQTAITHQERSHKRSPRNREFQNLLSSSYVKYAQFLRGIRQFEAAGAIALKRKELWGDEPSRLYRVAVELAKTANGIDEENRHAKTHWIDQATLAWNQAVALGWNDQQSNGIDPVLFSYINRTDRIPANSESE